MQDFFYNVLFFVNITNVNFYLKLCDVLDINKKKDRHLLKRKNFIKK